MELYRNFLKICLHLAVIAIIFSSTFLFAQSEINTFNIGVLARRGSEACLLEWLPTAQYLEAHIPGASFKIIPLAFEELTNAVKNANIDFVITNSASYVELQSQFDINRMVTIKRATPNGYSTLFGGIIFCRAERGDIISLKDLKGKSFMAVAPTSFGGWMAAWREFRKQGLDPENDFASLVYGETHDNVVYAVRDRKIDAGTVATPILERMIAEGKIAQDTFKIINQKVDKVFPYFLSTRLYPEWPFAKLKHTSDEIAEQVAIALLSMPKQSPAALSAQIAGWTVPLDYGPVEECMKELRIGIYKDYGKITISQLYAEYHWHGVGVIVLMTIMGCLLIFSQKLNRKLKLSEFSLLKEMEERHQINEKLLESNESLQQSRQQLANIIDFLPDATFVIDNDKKVIFWNRAMEEMTGVHKNDIIGMGDYAYTVPFYGIKRKQLLDLLENKDEEVISQYQYVKKRGGTLYAESFAPVLNGGKGAYFWATAASLYDVHGNRVGAIESIRDITEQKQTESEKEKLESHLMQARKMEAIGTLAGGIAHDFNNILGAILGFAEIAKDATLPETIAAKSLKRVIEAGNRAATLIKQILAFSRQTDIERVPLNPAVIVKEALGLLRPSLPSTIAIKLQLATATKDIYANPTQVHQILINLCTNAFHAMEQTGGTLEVTLKDCELSQKDLQQHPEIEPGSFVVLSIKDTGTGIDPDIWGRIFDPYFTTKEVGKGTGMGLSIVHGIVASYGGFINGESDHGNGSIFHVFFPAIEKEFGHEVCFTETSPPGTERILLVDDEEMLVEMGKTMLEQLGYAVTVRTSSLEALATFQYQPNDFDAVITDQTMPAMTGLNLARQMLKIRPSLPIILCTGYSNLINQDKAKNYGIKGFAMKPFSKNEIAVLLRQVLDEKLPS